MVQAIEIPYAEFEKLMGDLIEGPLGDGTDGKGRRFSITRYTSRTTGKRYDCVVTAGEGQPRCLEWPPLDMAKPAEGRAG